MIQNTSTPSAAITVYTITPGKAHDWAQCGGFYAARHGSGSRFPQSYASQLGSATHELAVAYDRYARSEAPDMDILIARHWRPGRFGTEDDARAREEARGLLDVYVRSAAAEDVEILDHECFVQTARRSLGDGRCIVLSGRMDRVARQPDGTIEVLDLKTGNSLPTSDELRRDPGTAIYHLLAQARFGGPDVVIAQLSLRTGGRVEVRLSADDVEAGKEKLRDMVRQMATGKFSLSPNGVCAYCPVRENCPGLRRSDRNAAVLPF